MDNRNKLIKLLAKVVAEMLQKGIVEERRPQIVWTHESIGVKWSDPSNNTGPKP